MMKRIVTLLLLLSIAFVSLTGCHGSRKSVAFELPEAFDTSKEYEITFWAKNDTNITQTNIYKKAIEDFEKIYPNITVTLKLYTNYETIYNDVITNIATGTTPNVCITYPDHIATYLTGENVVVPLEGLAQDPLYGLGGSEVRFDAPNMSEIVPQYLEECRLNGTLYALPYMRSTEACYINKTYVEALGYTVPDVLTWDFIWEVSEAAMEKDANGNFVVNGQKTMIPFLYKSTDNMMIQMLKQKDAGYSTENGEVLIFNDDTKEILLTIAEHAKTRAFSTFDKTGYPANFLNAGQCIFAIDSTAGATWMGSDAPLIDIAEDKIAQFETAVRMIPQYDPENPKMISQGPSMCLFNKEDPEEVLASWLFMQFLLTNDVQIAYSQTEGYVPVTTKAQTSEAYLEYLSKSGSDDDFYYDVKLSATKLLLEHVDDTFVTPVFNGSASLRSAAGHMIDTVNKAAWRRQTVDDGYIETLYRDTEALKRLDQIQVVGTGEDASGVRMKFQELPTVAVVLLVSIAAAWIFIGVFVLRDVIKKRKNNV